MVFDLQRIEILVCFSIQIVVDDSKNGVFRPRNSIRDTIYGGGST